MRHFPNVKVVIVMASLALLTSGYAFAAERGARDHRETAGEESEIIAPNNRETNEGGTTIFDEADALFGRRTDLGRESNIVAPNNRTTDPDNEVVGARRGTAPAPATTAEGDEEEETQNHTVRDHRD